jgi:hypothetical protein
MSYSIGPGVQQAIADNGDEPRSDERYVIMDEGHKVSLTLARDAQYWWYEEDNRVNRLPFLGDAVEDVYDPWTSMPGQLYDWTCSACSLDWVKRAMGLVITDDIYGSRETTVYEIGYPDHINPTYGLMDGSGAQLRRVLRDIYGQGSEQGWLSFDATYAVAQQGAGMMSGSAWYHWVGIRGVQGSNLAVANSAPGYKGIYDTLSREDFDRLGGFSVVWLT